MNYCPECGSSIERKQSADSFDNGGHMRFVCSSESCHFVNWNNPTPVVAAIITYRDQVMLVHNVGWPPKMLGLVSGFLEAKEHPDEAIKREIKEETNLDTHELGFVGHYPFPEQNQLIIAYAAECSGDISLNEELDRYKLLDIEKLVPWEIGTGPAVKDWLKRKLES